MMTKVQIYNKYGIEARKEKSAVKIYCEPLEMWINPVLVNGNKKIGRGCWHFSITAGNADITEEIAVLAVPHGAIGAELLKQLCGGTCNCNCAGCYAQSGCYTFRSTRISLARKTFLARYALAWLENAINAQIAADHIKMVRIHAAGDFCSISYVKAWTRIAQNNPDVIFWTYTKRYSDGAAMTEALNEFDALDNANIVKSVIDGHGLNYGHAGYLIAVYKTLKTAGKSVYICRCGIDKNQHCNNCHHCYTAEFVLFLEHGTSYDPERDPDYAAFVELVNSQAE